MIPNSPQRDKWNNGAKPLPRACSPSNSRPIPLGYTPFDIVLLAGVGFKSLESKQLDALSTWIKAGGAACVVVSGPLDSIHELFLNQLSEETYKLDSEGNLSAASGSAPNTHLYAEPGLGRLTVVFDPERDSIDFKNNDWVKTMTFLFRFKQDQIEGALKNRRWLNDRELTVKSDDYSNYEMRQYIEQWSRASNGRLQLQPLPGRIGGKLGEHMLPKDMKLLPGYIIFFILLLFVLVIGPLDYIILGKLKKRKYTWILFPLMSILFTLIMVKLAEHYMGTNDHRKTLRIVDVNAEGEILRENTLGLVFTGQHKTITEKGENNFISLVNHEGLSNFGNSYDSYGSSISTSGSDKPKGYAGRLPSNFEMTHQVKQWSPVMVRELRLGYSTHNKVPSLWPLKKDIKKSELAIKCETFDSKFDGRVMTLTGQKANNKSWGDRSNLDDEVIRELSVRPNIGFLSVISSVSPHGGGNFEDLTLLDTQDDNQTVVITLSENDNELIMHRCLIKGKDTP